MKHKILHLLLAAVVAFGIWAYVVTVVSPESEGTYYNIPVVLNNESILKDKGLMVETDTTPTVTLRLRGNRSDLNNLKNSDITIIADLSKINEAGTQELGCSIYFNGSPNAFEVLNQKPSIITLQIVEWATKEIPVVLDYSGSLGLDYIAYKDEAVLDRENITITGPKAVVDQITQAKITVDLNGRVESVSESYRYTLCDKDGNPVNASSIKTNAAEVNVTLKIHRVKQIQLVVDVIYGGGATAENTSIVLDQQIIKVSGSEKLLDTLGNTLTVGSVNLSEIPENCTLSFDINLQDGLENLSGITQVTASVSFTDLVTKTVSVTRIFASGTPEGMNADISAREVDVTVRGPRALMETISNEHIWITIDLAHAELGEERYKAQIWVDDAFDAVGIIGSYNIVVNVTETSGGAE